MERRFLEELKRLGIEVGPYNLPDWENDAASFHRCLDSLFRHTPPSALLLSEPALLFATQQYLSAKELAAPRDVSLISLDDHPAFERFEPEVSRIRTDTRRWGAAGGAVGGEFGERPGGPARDAHPRGIRRRRDDRACQGVTLCTGCRSSKMAC